MKNTVLLIHVVFIGIWLGCVLTEALFERLGQGPEQERILVGLHGPQVLTPLASDD